MYRKCREKNNNFKINAVQMGNDNLIHSVMGKIAQK